MGASSTGLGRPLCYTPYPGAPLLFMLLLLLLLLLLLVLAHIARFVFSSPLPDGARRKVTFARRPLYLVCMSCTAVEEAILLSCDIPTRQYILHVDQEQQRDHKKESFVIRQLDPTHLYVKARATPAPAWGMLRRPPVRCHLRRRTAWHCWRASLRSCRRCDDPCSLPHHTHTPHHTITNHP